MFFFTTTLACVWLSKKTCITPFGGPNRGADGRCLNIHMSFSTCFCWTTGIQNMLFFFPPRIQSDGSGNPYISERWSLWKPLVDSLQRWDRIGFRWFRSKSRQLWCQFLTSVSLSLFIATFSIALNTTNSRGDCFFVIQGWTWRPWQIPCFQGSAGPS